MVSDIIILSLLKEGEKYQTLTVKLHYVLPIKPKQKGTGELCPTK